MAILPIYLPAQTVHEHFSSQYVVFGWCGIVWVCFYLGQNGFLRVTAVVLSTALWPYIFHVISVKGTWGFLVTNLEWSHILTEGHIGKPIIWEREKWQVLFEINKWTIVNINMRPWVKVTCMAHSSYLRPRVRKSNLQILSKTAIVKISVKSWQLIRT